VHVEDVELEHFARRLESFGEGRPRAAMVPVDPLFDVGPRLRGDTDLRTLGLDGNDFR